MVHQNISFRVEQAVHDRFMSATDKLGLNASKVLREALTERLEELEQLVIVADQLKENRQRRSLDELCKELGLENKV